MPHSRFPYTLGSVYEVYAKRIKNKKRYSKFIRRTFCCGQNENYTIIYYCEISTYISVFYRVILKYRNTSISRQSFFRLYWTHTFNFRIWRSHCETMSSTNTNSLLSIKMYYTRARLAYQDNADKSNPLMPMRKLPQKCLVHPREMRQTFVRFTLISPEAIANRTISYMLPGVKNYQSSWVSVKRRDFLASPFAHQENPDEWSWGGPKRAREMLFSEDRQKELKVFRDETTTRRCDASTEQRSNL